MDVRVEGDGNRTAGGDYREERSVQVRIGILNQLSEAAITGIVTRFAAAMIAMGGKVETGAALAVLARHYGRSVAAK